MDIGLHVFKEDGYERTHIGKDTPNIIDKIGEAVSRRLYYTCTYSLHVHSDNISTLGDSVELFTDENNTGYALGNLKIGNYIINVVMSPFCSTTDLFLIMVPKPIEECLNGKYYLTI